MQLSTSISKRAQKITVLGLALAICGGFALTGVTSGSTTVASSETSAQGIGIVKMGTIAPAEQVTPPPFPQDPPPEPEFAFPPGPKSSVPAPNPVDAYASYVGQSTCDPTAKPGAQYILNMAINHYRIGRSLGIVRACNIGGASEHKEGRAFDWGVNVSTPAEKIAGDQFVEWLTARGPDGKVGYQARRLGVMYIIWNRQIWSNSSTNAVWKPYSGSSPHTDHVHVSLSWSGAYQRNSWWTGVAETTGRSWVGSIDGSEPFPEDPSQSDPNWEIPDPDMP